MKLKCIKCLAEADFIFDGNSLCIEHIPQQIKEVIKTARQKYNIGRI
jgi:hypothetical protein